MCTILFLFQKDRAGRAKDFVINNPEKRNLDAVVPPTTAANAVFALANAVAAEKIPNPEAEKIPNPESEKIQNQNSNPPESKNLANQEKILQMLLEERKRLDLINAVAMGKNPNLKFKNLEEILIKLLEELKLFNQNVEKDRLGMVSSK